MNRKLILIIVGLVIVGSAVVMGTRAYFSQQGEVKSNTFSTGTLALKLNEAEEATAVWDIDAGGPGDEVSGTVNIRNDGSIAANHIEITASNTVTEAASGPGTVSDTPLDTVLEITVLTYDGV
jgi:predicted ribosomally synthesized peptide with SipW-like signal peptide